MKAWLITVLVEAPCVALFYPARRMSMLLVCALTTSVTNLAMNLWLPRWLGVGSSFLVVGETSAAVIEAAVYYYVASRPRDLARAIAASTLANACSFAAGVFLL
jgi:hypothetical protein